MKVLHLDFFQISLICADSGAGVGTVIAPHIGYSCHDAMMEEMEQLVEACNTPATTTTTTTTTTATTTTTTPTINIVNNGTGSLNQMFNSDIYICNIHYFRWNH